MLILTQVVKIIIKTTNIKLDRALENFSKRKINDLEKFSKIFHQKYFISSCGKVKPKVEAWLEVGKTTLHHRKGPFFRAECQMRLPGKSLRSEACSEDLRSAIVKVKDKLQRQLKQYKNKFIAKTKRRQRKFKKSHRLASGAKFKIKKGARIREEGALS